MRLKRVGDLLPGPVLQVWYRAIRIEHLRTALATAHSRATPSRFSAGTGDFEIVYLGEDYETIIYEAQAQLGSPYIGSIAAGHSTTAWVHIGVNVRVSRVVNLCDSASLKVLSSSIQELTGNWDGYSRRGAGCAPTQALGKALFESGLFDGFIAFSAKIPTKRILALFPERMVESGGEAYVTLPAGTLDPHRSQTFRIP